MSLAVPAEQVHVLCQAESVDGPVEQTIVLPAPKGVPREQIIQAAIALFRQQGGFIQGDLMNGEGIYYPALTLRSPIRFTIKSVVLAGADALPGGQKLLV
jgi:hypothetical protein